MAGIKKGNLIGLKMKVVDADNTSQLQIEGKIVDETRHTLVVYTGKGMRRLAKSRVKLLVNNQMINGKDLVGRPEERIKKSR